MTRSWLQLSRLWPLSVGPRNRSPSPNSSSAGCSGHETVTGPGAETVNVVPLPSPRRRPTERCPAGPALTRRPGMAVPDTVVPRSGPQRLTDGEEPPDMTSVEASATTRSPAARRSRGSVLRISAAATPPSRMSSPPVSEAVAFAVRFCTRPALRGNSHPHATWSTGAATGGEQPRTWQLFTSPMGIGAELFRGRPPGGVHGSDCNKREACSSLPRRWGSREFWPSQTAQDAWQTASLRLPRCGGRWICLVDGLDGDPGHGAGPSVTRGCQVAHVRLDAEVRVDDRAPRGPGRRGCRNTAPE